MPIYPKKKGVPVSSLGPIKRTRIAYDSPEYKTAYDQGHVTRYDPVSEIHNGKTMDTFTVEGKRITTADDFKNINWKKEGMKVADVATDVMQLGNFIPHPAGQIVGKLGSVLGAGIDGYQAVDAFGKRDYKEAGINAGSAVLGAVLGRGTFKRNPKFLSSNSFLGKIAGSSGKRTPYLNVDQQVKNQTKSQLNTNRALLGGIGAETIYDTEF